VHTNPFARARYFYSLELILRLFKFFESGFLAVVFFKKKAEKLGFFRLLYFQNKYKNYNFMKNKVFILSDRFK